jgi:hypothetical protein
MGPLPRIPHCKKPNNQTRCFAQDTIMSQRSPRWSADEETLLVRLRSQNPHYTWEELAFVFNAFVPIERWRSCDALKKKSAKLLRFMYDSSSPHLPPTPSRAKCPNVDTSPLPAEPEALSANTSAGF